MTEIFNKQTVKEFRRELRNAAGHNFFDLREMERYVSRTDRLPEVAIPAILGSQMAVTSEDPIHAVAVARGAGSHSWRPGGTGLPSTQFRPER